MIINIDIAILNSILGHEILTFLIKFQNFEEQLSAVSSFMTHIPQNRTKDEVNINM